MGRGNFATVNVLEEFPGTGTVHGERHRGFLEWWDFSGWLIFYGEMSGGSGSLNPHAALQVSACSG